jgi:hypothetical protein
MDFRSRRGSILVETLMLVFFFISIMVIYESKTKNHIGSPKKNRWEKKHE